MSAVMTNPPKAARFWTRIAKKYARDPVGKGALADGYDGNGVFGIGAGEGVNHGNSSGENSKKDSATSMAGNPGLENPNLMAN